MFHPSSLIPHPFPLIPHPFPFVTIVSGLPRSGTSLMMQMLAAGGLPLLTDGVRGPDPDNPRGYYEFEPVKRTREDPSWLSAARGKAVKVIYALLHDLPTGESYRVIFMRRDIAEIIVSQRAMLARLGRAGASMPDARLGEVFGDQVERCSEWLRSQPNFSVLDVRYDQLLADPAPAAAAVDRFLDGGLDTAAMVKVVDPSLYRAGRRHMKG